MIEPNFSTGRHRDSNTKLSVYMKSIRKIWQHFFTTTGKLQLLSKFELVSFWLSVHVDFVLRKVKLSKKCRDKMSDIVCICCECPCVFLFCCYLFYYKIWSTYSSVLHVAKLVLSKILMHWLLLTGSLLTCYNISTGHVVS